MAFLANVSIVTVVFSHISVWKFHPAVSILTVTLLQEDYDRLFVMPSGPSCGIEDYHLPRTRFYVS